MKSFYVFLKLLFLILAFLTFSVVAKADAEIWSAAIYYKSSSTGLFTVDVKVVARCGTDSTLNAPLRVQSSCSSFTVSGNRISSRDVTGVGLQCQNQPDCFGGATAGMIEVTLRYQVDVSNLSCCDFTFLYGQKRRPYSISTGYSGLPVLVSATASTCNGVVSSSVQPTLAPVWRIRYNQDIVLVNGEIDSVDNDSVSFELIPLLHDTIYSVGTPPYTYNRPLNFFGYPNQNVSYPAGFRIDNYSGTLLFRPTSYGQVATIAIRANEWRRVNGTMTKVGSTDRDFTLRVDSLSSPQIRISLHSSTAPIQVKEVCAGEKYCFPVSVLNTGSTADSLTLSWNAALSGATFQISKSGANDSGQVCWTPRLGDTLNKPFILSFTAKGIACPAPRSTGAEIQFYVKKPLSFIPHTIFHQGCGKVNVARDTSFSVTQLWVFTDSAKGTQYSSNKISDNLLLPPGKYYTRVTMSPTASSACRNIYDDSIVIPKYADVSFSFPDTALCVGDSLHLNTVTSGITMHYQWSRGGVPTNDTTADLKLFPAQSGTYRLIATDQGMCRDSAFVTVYINALPGLNLGADRKLCGINSTVVNAGNYMAYKWNTGAVSPDITVTATGTYWVQVTDSNFCRNSDTVLIRMNPLPNPELGSDRNTCADSLPRLDPGVFSSYVWNTGDTTRELVAHSSGTYYVAVTDSSGCSKTDTIKVTIRPLPVIDLGPDQDICQGDSVQLSAGSGFASYQWSTGVQNVTIQVSQGGDYSVKVSANGCFNSDTIKVTVNPVPLSILDSVYHLCLHDTITLNAGAGFYTYLWTGGSILPTLSVTDSGTYSVEITTDKQCKKTFTTRVELKSLPMIDLGNDTAVCEGSSPVLAVSGTYSSYLWSTGQASASISATTSGAYWLRVKDQFGCKAIDTINVDLLPLPDAGFSYLQNVQFSYTFTPDQLGLQYLWNFGDGHFDTATQPVHTYAGPGSPVVKLIVRSGNGCVDSSSQSLLITSVKSMAAGANVRLYPNPFRAGITLEFYHPSRSTVNFAILDVNGKTVWNESWLSEPGTIQKELNLTTLEPGFYMLTLQTPSGLETVRLVKVE